MSATLNESTLEKKLWDAADALRGHMDASEYSNVVLGLMFLKYISDSFGEERTKLLNSDYPEDYKDKDAYIAQDIFWVPKDARWSVIKSSAKKSNIGQIIDNAMISIEHSNQSLRGILPKDYASPDLHTSHLGEVIDLISNMKVGTKSARKKDILGRVYEYFLKNFALQEGHRGGEFYTPRSVVQTLVEILEPYKGRVYDPCCGSGGMFIQSHKFLERHKRNPDDIAVYGEESNPRTWKLCKMNLAIRGIDGDLGPHQGDTFLNDLHKGKQFDYILANPPFNQVDWGQKELIHDPRWKYGLPPADNANYAWLQHIISKLTVNGKAGVVLASGALSTMTKREYVIRKNMIDDDKVDAIISLPSNMFYSVTIPASLWIINNNKKKNRSHILFIRADNLGHMIDRTHRDFSKNDISKIAQTYRAYCGETNILYRDRVGFCKKVNTNIVKENNFILTPGLYVGIHKDKVSRHKLQEDIIKLSHELNLRLNEDNKLGNRIKLLLKDLNNG